MGERKAKQPTWEEILHWPGVRATGLRCRIGDPHVYGLLASGVLVGFKLGGEWRVSPESIAAYEVRPRRWRKNRNRG